MNSSGGKAGPSKDKWLWELKELEAMVSRKVLRKPGLRTKGLVTSLLGGQHSKPGGVALTEHLEQ